MGLSSNEEFAFKVADTVSNQGIDAAKQLFGKTLSKDLLNKETGDMIDEKGTLITEEKLEAWRNIGVIEKSIKISAIDSNSVLSKFSSALAMDKSIAVADTIRCRDFHTIKPDNIRSIY